MKKSKMSQCGMWALRLTAGLIFIHAGWGKLADMTTTTGMFVQMGFPMAAFWAWVTALVEFIGGIALILGVATHFMAGLLAITMIVATFVVLRSGPLMMLYAPVALLGSTLALFGLGGGSCQLWKPKGCTGICCMEKKCCNDDKGCGCDNKETKK